MYFYFLLFLLRISLWFNVFAFNILRYYWPYFILIYGISTEKLELVRHFDCSYNEFVLSLELFSNEELKISIVSLKDLAYF